MNARIRRGLMNGLAVLGWEEFFLGGILGMSILWWNWWGLVGYILGAVLLGVLYSKARRAPPQRAEPPPRFSY